MRYSLRSPSGERVTAIEIRVDGRPLPGDQGVVKLPNGPSLPDAEQDGTLSVPIEKDATITLVARAGELSSEAANLRLASRPAVPVVAAPPIEVPKPKLYVLAVGISTYKDPTLELHYAAKDATDVAAAWAKQQGGLYPEVETRVLRDEQATRAAVLPCVRHHPQVIVNALEILKPRRTINWTSGRIRARMRTAAPVLNPG